MAVVSKVLGAGQLSATTLTAIATLGGAERGVGIMVELSNTHTAAVLFDIAINSDGTDRYKFSGELEAKLSGREVGGTVEYPIVALDVGDIVKVKVSVANVVNYHVFAGSQT